MSTPVDNLRALTVEDFGSFYEAIHGHTPFQWQQRLAKMACVGQWPSTLKLPTASGKTAAIDAALFALAFQAAEANRPGGQMTAGRRIFFVVDRRIIVNEAHRRAEQIAQKLQAAASDENADSDANIIKRVALWLKQLTGDDDAPPLDCFELRGGIYRDDAWVRSPLQPTVLSSTVDQVGSRLLFRGYGVSDRNLPIHAALTSHDSLIFLDEAHCSRPFGETMYWIQRYRGEPWADETLKLPFQFVQMTATPTERDDDSNILELTEEDYATDEPLRKRHDCPKPVQLVLAEKAKASKLSKVLSDKIVKQALQLVEEQGCRRIAIVVNRVAIARKVFQQLQELKKEAVSLMIGRMRPRDRDKMTPELLATFGAKQGKSTQEDTTRFVVATQCLEVGADLDFDGMVTQCASLDALRQRFGRLDRLGGWNAQRNKPVCGVIVAAEGDVPPKEKLPDTTKSNPLDPIYGNALAHTWHWLQEKEAESADGTIDFGIRSFDAKLEAMEEEDRVQLLAPSESAPILMPAHMDLLCQTAPRPTPEPDVSHYLHGPRDVSPDVRVCWRADLNLTPSSEQKNRWISTIQTCPPTSAECMPVPLYLFRQWLRGERGEDASGDVLGEAVDATDGSDDPKYTRREVLLWRGIEKPNRPGSIQIDGRSVAEIRPGETIVIPIEQGGWEFFGHVPAHSEGVSSEFTARELYQAGIGQEAALGSRFESAVKAYQEIAPLDIADHGFLQSRRKVILRFHPKLKTKGDLGKLCESVLKEFGDPDKDLSLKTLKDLVKDFLANRNQSTETEEIFQRALLELLKEPKFILGGKIFRYEGGLAWISKRLEKQVADALLCHAELPLASFGDEDDELSCSGSISLSQHLVDVEQAAKRFSQAAGLTAPLDSTTTMSARLHDLGKADPRFQAMLLGMPLSIAYMQPVLMAKSDQGRSANPTELPEHFRHEMLSVDLVDQFDLESVDRELLKHQIAAHHGYARPFAPICIDEKPEGIELNSLGGPTFSETDRQNMLPLHRLDSGIAERFWNLNRTFGWWGLAYLETVVRLADWQASASPGDGQSKVQLPSIRSTDTGTSTEAVHSEFKLLGIDGSNPLGFLAALGVLRTLDTARPSSVFMNWAHIEGAWRPVIQINDTLATDNETLLDLLTDLLVVSEIDSYPPLRLSEFIDSVGMRQAFATAAQMASLTDHCDADWLSCNGSDLVDKTVISQLQTTRRDYHPINVRGLLENTTREHLQRSLFEPWDYGDPLAGVSLHLEPREDRRHAYQWHMPSGDPTKSSSGGMIGANRLALEAWPLFQSLPRGEKLTTVGFHTARGAGTRFTWPIWNRPISLAITTSLLAYQGLQAETVDHAQLKPLGIAATYRCNRILVGKTPNLTVPTSC